MRLYAEGYGGNQAALNAVMGRVVCPGGLADGSCSPGDIERVRIDLINWPGIKTSGFDFHLHGHVDAGVGELSFGLDSTYTTSLRAEETRTRRRRLPRAEGRRWPAEPRHAHRTAAA